VTQGREVLLRGGWTAIAYPSQKVDYEPFIESQLVSTQLKLGTFVSQVWSHYPQNGGLKTLVVHQVVGPPLLLVHRGFHDSFNPTFPPVQGYLAH